MTINGEPVRIGGEQFTIHRSWGNWYPKPDPYRVGVHSSPEGVVRAIRKAQQAKSGQGKKKGGGFLDPESWRLW